MRILVVLLLIFPSLVQAQEKKDAKPKPADWRVDAAHGPESTIKFETDEGSWISVDVSPDGKQLVFDLLGDLYLLPIAGGQATPLTRGRAYDFQPRWSPDGKRICFTSDRGGTDNAWVVGADGKGLRAISRQKDKVTNSPDWHPGGEYLLVRRRLTDRSSLGTVELWMIHTRGGTGVQVTKKTVFGDANGPVFGPDGRYIYFAGRAERFRYNRNTDNGFWQLKRFDMTSGELRTISSGGGGSARPRVSPDGRSIAFVRRIRARSCLFVHDLTTGAERQVTDALSPDMQESFAWTGSYPGYAWMPDGKQIVITAAGKLWRLDVASGKRTQIPFRVNVERQVAQRLRFKQQIDSDTLSLKILRWPQRSADGKRLYFGALGQLYVMDSPDGTPRRLTKSAQLEYCPSLSPDGQWLVYAVWNDQQGGHLFKCRADGSGVTQLTRQAGHYIRPIFSPDGRTILFIRGSNAYRRSARLSGEDWRELASIPAGGGKLRSIKKLDSVSRLAFTPDGKRIFLVAPGKEEHSLLVSVDRNGKDLRQHLKIKHLGELAVSPDGKWVAYQQRYELYVTAIPLISHQLIEAGGQLPHFKLSTGGGDWPSWSADSRTVTYSLGATFYSQDLREALDRAQEKQHKRGKKADWKIQPKAQSIRLTVKRARPEGQIAYTHARIITMKGDQVIASGTIVVSGNKISAIGPSDSTQIPQGCRTIDLKGRTIIPGFVDVHAHLHWGYRDIFPEQDHSYFANLAYGVTTVHDPSASSQTVFGQAERVAAGRTTGPRVFSTGTILYGAGGGATAKIDKLEDALRHVRRIKAYGGISVKSYMQPRREQRQWIISAARAEKMMVVPEGGGNLEMNLSMAIDGHSGIEHTLPVAPLYKDVIQLFARSGVGITPTMLVSYGGISGERWFYKHFDVWKDSKLLRFTPRDSIDRRSRRREVGPEEDYHHFRIARSLKRLVEAGGRVHLGSHGQLQGLGAQWELWAIAQGGMKPLDALRCATIYGAAYIGMSHAIGSLEVGKLADFQVLAGNPLKDLRQTNTHVYIVANGNLFDATTMDQLWPIKRKCPKFFWQRK